MPSPFPGMDPYLEHPALWPDVHNQLVAELRRSLGPKLRPHYVVCIEERTYLDPDGLALVSRPDLSVVGVREGRSRRPLAGYRPGEGANAGARTVSVNLPIGDRARETYLEIRTLAGGDAVTLIEILSPSNKLPGRGRRIYEAKRRVVLDSLTHLVEIDLLRTGTPMPMEGDLGGEYRLLVSRSEHRPRAELALFSVRDAIPAFDLPLRGEDQLPGVNLRESLDAAYDTAGYDLRVDYRGDAVPPLSPADRDWSASLLAKAGLRP